MPGFAFHAGAVPLRRSVKRIATIGSLATGYGP
jgi:hypothetical protein